MVDGGSKSKRRAVKWHCCQQLFPAADFEITISSIYFSLTLTFHFLLQHVFRLTSIKALHLHQLLCVPPSAFFQDQDFKENQGFVIERIMTKSVCWRSDYDELCLLEQRLCLHLTTTSRKFDFVGTKTNRVDELFAGAKEKKLAAGFSHTTPSQTVHAKLVKSKFNYTPRNQPICRPQSWLQISFSRLLNVAIISKISSSNRFEMQRKLLIIDTIF